MQRHKWRSDSLQLKSWKLITHGEEGFQGQLNEILEGYVDLCGLKQS